MRGSSASGARRGLLLAAFVIPWIQPLAGGPSAAVQPWLISAACAMVMLLLAAGPLPWRLVVPALALGGWAALGPGGAGVEKATLLAYLLLVLAGASATTGWLRTGGEAAWLARALLVAALGCALIGLLQYFGLSSALQPWVYASGVGEALSNLRQRNQLGSACMLGAAALLWLAPPDRVRPGHVIAMALLACAAAATTSRTVLLQYLALGALLAWWAAPGARAPLRLWIGGVVAYGVAALLLPLALQVATGGAGSSLLDRVAAVDACSSRRVLWWNVLQLVAQKPLAGWGWGNLDFAHYLNLYPGERFCDILDNAHNLPLHLAVELGLPVALLLCGWLFWRVLRARPWRESPGPRRLGWALLVPLAIHSLVEYPLWYGPFQLALGVALGLLVVTRRDDSPAVPRVPRALAVLGLAGVAYAAWDYDRVSQLYLEPEQRRAWWREDTQAHARQSVLFATHARFAELTLAPLTRDNVRWTDAAAQALLHYSPEPRIIERVIESATMQERYDDAVLHLARYRAAFPKDYAIWRDTQKRMPEFPVR